MNAVRFSVSLVLTIALVRLMRGRFGTSLGGEIVKTTAICVGSYLAFSWGAGRFRILPLILLTVCIVALRAAEVLWWEGSWSPLVWGLVAVLLMAGQVGHSRRKTNGGSEP
jgi:hypothetical protein